MTGGNSGIGLAGALGVGIMLVSGVPAAAPSVAGGGEVGLSVATLASFSEQGGQALVDPEWRTGPTAGGFLRFRITDRIGFQPVSFYVVPGVTLLFHLNANVALEDGRDVDDIKAAVIAITVGASLQGRRWLVAARFNLGLRDFAEPELALDRAARRRRFAILTRLRF